MGVEVEWKGERGDDPEVVIAGAQTQRECVLTVLTEWNPDLTMLKNSDLQ